MCVKRHMCTYFYIQIGVLSVSFALSKNKITTTVIEAFFILTQGFLLIFRERRMGKEREKETST